MLYILNTWSCEFNRFLLKFWHFHRHACWLGKGLIRSGIQIFEKFRDADLYFDKVHQRTKRVSQDKFSFFSLFILFFSRYILPEILPNVICIRYNFRLKTIFHQISFHIVRPFYDILIDCMVPLPFKFCFCLYLFQRDWQVIDFIFMVNNYARVKYQRMK